MQTGTNSDISAAFKSSIPVMMGYIPLGIVFGFLFVQAGAQWWLAIIASMMIYGGASQYMMVPMMAAGMPISAIAFATFVINLRHIFYGLSILNKLPKTGWPKWLVAFWLTDETYSLICSFPEGTSVKKILWLACFDHCWWILGSGLGAVLGTQIASGLAGIDFVLTSLFAMLLCEQWRARSSSNPVWVAIASYVVARLISVENALALSIAFCCVGAYILSVRESKKLLNTDGDSQ